MRRLAYGFAALAAAVALGACGHHHHYRTPIAAEAPPQHLPDLAAIQAAPLQGMPEVYEDAVLRVADAVADIRTDLERHESWKVEGEFRTLEFTASLLPAYFRRDVVDVLRTQLREATVDIARTVHNSHLPNADEDLHLNVVRACDAMQQRIDQIGEIVVRASGSREVDPASPQMDPAIGVAGHYPYAGHYHDCAHCGHPYCEHNHCLFCCSHCHHENSDLVPVPSTAIRAFHRLQEMVTAARQAAQTTPWDFHRFYAENIKLLSLELNTLAEKDLFTPLEAEFAAQLGNTVAQARQIRDLASRQLEAEAYGQIGALQTLVYEAPEGDRKEFGLAVIPRVPPVYVDPYTYDPMQESGRREAGAESAQTYDRNRLWWVRDQQRWMQHIHYAAPLQALPEPQHTGENR